MVLPSLDEAKAAVLRRGVVIPAHPLALSEARRLDERRQGALSRYYLAAGAGGLAVAVHTTQFAIREPSVGLLRPILELAADVARQEAARPAGIGDGADRQMPILVAGVLGRTPQACDEATLARDLGYDLALVQLAAFGDAGDDEIVEHCEHVAEILPLFGFYLQPAVGGRHFGRDFWRRFAAIPNAAAVKIAPFDRYATLEVIQGVAASGRADEVALYTGNDDHIVLDLLTPWCVDAGGGPRTFRITGGLLGHWAVWTRRAVAMLDAVHALPPGAPIPSDLLDLAVRVTDANAAFFDPPHRFAGSIAGIHEVLRRQGLLGGRWCLDPDEDLSPGQLAEIDRVYAAYPDLNDDEFVAEHLDEWLR